MMPDWKNARGATINSEIAEGICKYYKKPTQTPKRLERQHVTVQIPKSWLRWTKCLNIIVRLKDQMECGPVELPPCKLKTTLAPCPLAETRTLSLKSVTQSLQNHAKKSQANVLRLLKSHTRSSSLSTHPLWIVNAIVIEGASLNDVKEILGDTQDVLDVWEEMTYELPILNLSSPAVGPKVRSQNQTMPMRDNWNINLTGIHKVLAKGINGSGIVFGMIDTGVEGTHEGLRDNFRGGDYGWFDPIHYRSEPYDDGEHGTFVMGIMLGQKEGVGAAPGGQWIACKGCGSDKICAESALLRCAQWILCPTKSDGSDPDCSKAPHIVNNSFGRSHSSSNKTANFEALFRTLINCWRAAGIIPVAAAGNKGYVCKSIDFLAMSDKVIAVGNIGKDTEGKVSVWWDSSRGPVPSSPTNIIKPDVAAPGTPIYTTFPGNIYGLAGGTSMASPLVAGTVALMLQWNSSLTYNDIYNALTQTADRVEPADFTDFPKVCGSVEQTQFPNYHVGYGMINAYKAVFGPGGEGEDVC